jgi:hypothetical protein
VRIGEVVATRLWEGDVDRLSTGASGHLVLAHRERDGGVRSVRVFGAAAPFAPGPEIDVEGPVCLIDMGDAPGAHRSAAPRRVLAVEAVPGCLRTWDARTGEPLAEVATRSSVEDVLAVGAASIGGRVVVVVYGWLDRSTCGWEAYDPRTGRRSDPRGDSHYAYFLWEARIAAVADMLVVTAQETRAEIDGDIQDAVARIHHLPGGALLGSVDLAGETDGFAAAVVGGKPLLAAAGRVYALPSLTEVARVPGATGPLALGEIGGRATVVCGLAASRGALGLWHVDECPEGPPEPVSAIRGPWGDRIGGLAPPADGETLLVAAETGLYAVPLAGPPAGSPLPPVA